MLRDVSRYFEMLREVSVKLLRVQAGSNPWLDDVAHLVQHCGRGWNLMTWQTEWRDSMWGCWIAIGPCLHEVVSTCLNMIQHDSTWFSMVWFDVYSLAFIWQQQYECSWCRIIWTCLNMFEQFEEDEHTKNMKWPHWSNTLKPWRPQQPALCLLPLRQRVYFLMCCWK